MNQTRIITLETAISVAFAKELSAALIDIAPEVAREGNTEQKRRLCEALLKESRIYRDCQKYGHALELLIAITIIAPQQTEIWRMIAQIAGESHDLVLRHQALQKLIELNPDDADLWQQSGVNLRKLNDYDGALSALQTARQLAPDHMQIIEELAVTARFNFDWNLVEELEGIIASYTTECLESGQPSCETPMFVPCRYDDEARINRIYAAQYQHKWQEYTAYKLNVNINNYDPDRIIRLGYLSSDYYDHPVMHLLTGLFRHHDRKRYHICAFSTFHRPDDPCQQAIMNSVDQFVIIAGQDELSASKIISEHNIDILIDLRGLTVDSSIAFFRPAPIIVNWLGFPGSMGSRDVDYIIADPYVIPHDAEAIYPEAVARMPLCYMIPDHINPVHQVQPPTNHIIPVNPENFVLGGWSHPAKISRSVFDCWMQIMQQIPTSVLVLRPMSDAMRDRLSTRAAMFGIKAERLHCWPYVPDRQAHLDRLPRIDLWLDTWPYGSHSTGCDALWAGVPILTMKGNHFASRVGESLLRAVGLPGLIASDTDDYIAKAVQLAQDKSAMQRIRDHLRYPETLPLFQTPARVRDIEALYRAMWHRACAGLPPAGLDLANL